MRGKESIAFDKKQIQVMQNGIMVLKKIMRLVMTIFLSSSTIGESFSLLQYGI